MRWRPILAAFLTAGGLTLSAFFWLLFAITDCSKTCVARGERAVPLALVGLGLGMLGAGIILRRDPRRTLAVGLLASGISATGGIAWIMIAEGSRGQATWLLLAAMGVAGAGVWAQRRATRG